MVIVFVFLGRRHILRIIILELISFPDLHLEELVFVVLVIYLAQNFIVLDRVISLFDRMYEVVAVLQKFVLPKDKDFLLV